MWYDTMYSTLLFNELTYRANYTHLTVWYVACPVTYWGYLIVRRYRAVCMRQLVTVSVPVSTCVGARQCSGKRSKTIYPCFSFYSCSIGRFRRSSMVSVRSNNLPTPKTLLLERSGFLSQGRVGRGVSFVVNSCVAYWLCQRRSYTPTEFN